MNFIDNFDICMKQPSMSYARTKDSNDLGQQCRMALIGQELKPLYANNNDRQTTKITG